jgi:hypothetical protein
MSFAAAPGPVVCAGRTLGSLNRLGRIERRKTGSNLRGKPEQRAQVACPALPAAGAGRPAGKGSSWPHETNETFDEIFRKQTLITSEHNDAASLRRPMSGVKLMNCWGAVTIGTMRLNQARSLHTYCPQCDSVGIANAESFADDTSILALQSQLSCPACGYTGCEVRPNWTNRENAPGTSAFSTAA